MLKKIIASVCFATLPFVGVLFAGTVLDGDAQASIASAPGIQGYYEREEREDREKEEREEREDREFEEREDREKEEREEDEKEEDEEREYGEWAHSFGSQAHPGQSAQSPVWEVR